ncbi:hypothetical protein ACLB2K_051091 [Fragaria x ananassa]
MSCFNYSFIWLLFLSSALVASASDKKHHKGPVVTVTKQLTFPDFNLSYNPRILNDVKLLGSAKLASNTTAIQIPNESHVDDLRHQAGRAIYSSSIRLLDPHTETPASFETTFSFQFHNASSSSAERIEMTQSGGYGVGGSGLTFVIVPDEFTVGRPGAWLAMLNDACEDDYKVIAIEFDTRLNPEFGDPNDNHVGINLGTIISTETINASDFSSGRSPAIPDEIPQILRPLTITLPWRSPRPPVVYLILLRISLDESQTLYYTDAMS